jgi:SAM-dependent methyltransferase
MTHREALALIDTPYLRNLSGPTRWADLGCGSGTFTLALADLLAPGSYIDAIDLKPTIAAQTTNRGVVITPRTGDFTRLPLTGDGPARLDGILMANSLHYVRDQQTFLTHLHASTNILLLIEYDTDRPVARWVPYPLSFITATRLLQSTGWPRVQKLGTRPSKYFVGAASPRSSSSVPFASLGNGRAELYAALALAP